MRICLISNPNSIHVRRALDFLIGRGHELAFVGYAPPEQPLPAGVRFLDLTTRFNVRKLRYLVWPLLVRQWLQQIRPDILHAHSVTGAGWLAAYAAFHPFLLTSHGSDLLLLPTKSWAHQQLSMQALREADYVTCVSQGLLQKARSLGVQPERSELVLLGVDTNLYAPTDDRSALQSALGLGPGPVVLGLRAFKPIYHPMLIAEALPRILLRFPTTQLVMFKANAEPQTLAQFQAAIEQQGLTKTVRYVEPLWDERAVADYTCAADVGVSVASSDGTPKSVQEAMACEVPVVAGDIPALRDCIRSGYDGLLVPLGDAASLAAAIIRLLEDGDLRRALGQQARRTICERADSKVWMARSEEIYAELIRAHSERTGIAR